MNGNLRRIGSIAMIKSTGSQSMVIALFKKPADHVSGNDSNQQCSCSNNSRKWGHEDELEIDVGDEIVKQFVYEMETLETQMEHLTILAEESKNE